MTPTPLALAVLLLTAPVFAADLPWDKYSDKWETASFEDANGVSRTFYFFQTSWDEAKQGDEIPLYRFTAVSEDWVYDARQVAYKAVVVKDKGYRQLTITLPTTALNATYYGAALPSLSHDSAELPAYAPPPTKYSCPTNSCHQPNTPRVDLLDLPQFRKKPAIDYNAWVVEPKAKILIKANYPKLGREATPKTFFPENAWAVNSGPLADPPAATTPATRIKNRFLPYELAFDYDKILAPALAGVTDTEISADKELLKAAGAGGGDPAPLNAFAQKRRQEILEKAKELYDDFSSGAKSRPDKFSKTEGYLLWILVAKTGNFDKFKAEVAKALAADEKAQAGFVHQYRRMLMYALTHYRDHAAKLKKTAGTIEDTSAKYNAEVKAFVTATVANDPAQIKKNGSAPSGAPTVVSKKVTGTPGPQKKPEAPNGKVYDMYYK